MCSDLLREEVGICLLTRMFQEPTKCVPYPRCRMKPTSMILLNMKFDCDNMKDRTSEEDTQQQHYAMEYLYHHEQHQEHYQKEQ